MDYVCVVLSIVFISIQNMKIISQHNYFSMVILHPILYYKLWEIYYAPANDSRYSGFNKIKYGIYI